MGVWPTRPRELYDTPFFSTSRLSHQEDPVTCERLIGFQRERCNLLGTGEFRSSGEHQKRKVNATHAQKRTAAVS